jgi:hypothetical protein
MYQGWNFKNDYKTGEVKKIANMKYTLATYGGAHSNLINYY